MDSLLESLFTKYGTDKGIWGYTGAYEKYLEARRFTVRRVLEIGICGHRDIPNNVVGASLFAWRDYFPNAESTASTTTTNLFSTTTIASTRSVPMPTTPTSSTPRSRAGRSLARST